MCYSRRLLSVTAAEDAAMRGSEEVKRSGRVFKESSSRVQKPDRHQWDLCSHNDQRQYCQPTWIARDVHDMNPRRERVQCRRDDDARNVIDGHRVDGVDDPWPRAELDAALEHSDEEVVHVAHAGLRVPKDVSGSDHRSEEFSPASLAYELLGHPLGLPVARA
ncbi:hypothetical protein VTN31DRAFT_6388 [Thermomyces dupontii]|uniref:uncharacterized protein n=1 Tax=Talaromyces thermophilus TaxID=28565 RepID=UPI003743DF9E